LLQRYALGDFSESIHIPDEEDELTELLVALSLMVDDIQEMIQEKEDTIAQLGRAEKALRVQWERFLAIIGSFPEMLYVADPETYEVLFANQILAEALGADPVGKTCYRAFQGLDAPCDFCTNEIILREKVPYTWEYHNPLLDRYYLITDQIIEWPDGRDVRFEMAIDMTDRQQAEEKLRESEEQFSKAFHASPIISTITSLQDGRFIDVNETFVRLSGYRRDEVIGRSALELDIYDDPSERTETMRAMSEEGEVYNRELKVRTKSGETLDVLVSSAAIEIGGEPCVLVVGHNTTERKQAEEKIKQTVKELERFNRLAVGREKRMIALKRQVNELAQELGRAPPYDLAFAE
jgi:PAS domain S-box-containing protein